MAEYRLGEVEMKFADIIWENEPIASGELVKLSGQRLQWKKSTTYTILKRLCEREIFQNVDGVVTSLISKEQFQLKKGEEFLDENYGGSLPSFVAAFASRKKLSKDDIAYLKKLLMRAGNQAKTIAFTQDNEN